MIASGRIGWLLIGRDLGISKVMVLVWATKSGERGTCSAASATAVPTEVPGQDGRMHSAPNITSLLGPLHFDKPPSPSL